MFGDPARERFTSMVQLDDDDIDLLAAVFLVAQEEYPRLRVSEEMSRVDDLAEEVAVHVDLDTPTFQVLFTLNQVLFRHHGFRGNVEHYDDPDNSMMNMVLDRETGIPITLSILYMEIAQRVGLLASGVNFPGHFVVRVDDEYGGCFVDPFHQGQILLSQDLRRRLTRVLGEDAPWRDEYLEPASNKAILMRLLYNLKRRYLRDGDLERALMAAERIVILNPKQPRELRDRGLLYSKTGHREAAIADLQDYLELHPAAPDAERIRSVLSGLLGRREAEG